MRVTTKGQVTIPIEVREKLGILPGTEVEISVSADFAKIVKAKNKKGKKTRGQLLIERATGKGTANTHLTTDEIMALTRDWGEDDIDR